MKMKLNLTIVFVLLLFVGISSQSLAQGCVAIRNMSCSGAGLNLSTSNAGFLNPGEWQASLNYRYFRSFRHFRGTHEEANRVEEGTEVINIVNSFDLGLGYSVSNRLSLNVTLPVTTFDRSSLYEHYGNSAETNPDHKRFHTQANGIGDLRLSATYWMLDPAKHHKGNFALGIGIKAPTGNANVQDDFHKLDKEGNDYTIRKAVDQSIQLGDGGWGVSLEAQGYQVLFANTSLYFDGFYLSNPRNVNETLRSPTADPNEPDNYFSVADQYAARLGLSYMLGHATSLSLGGRIEGIPAFDVIGKEQGFRRPGYVISVEPGITQQVNRFVLNLNIPVALVRDRIRNTQDIASGKHGDAAFADYLINAGIAYRFGGKKESQPPLQNWNDLNNH